MTKSLVIGLFSFGVRNGFNNLTDHVSMLD